MRRFRDRQSNRLFRGGELARMLTMVSFLLVLVMVFLKARDPDTWRFLANDPAPVSTGETDEPRRDEGSDTTAESHKPAGDVNETAPAEGAATDAMPPLDEDPEERAAIADEFEVITDRAPIVKEDMFAYWRLLRWTEDSPLPAMLKRARSDVRYGDLILDPAAHRGQLMKVRLHVVQLLKLKAAPDNPLGLETYYQAVGWNDSSQAWFYFCIFTDLPRGMPLGDRITTEGTFVGYFLKTTTYQDGLGKGSQAPVLIGRMIWHPSPQAPKHEEESLLPWLIGGLLLAGFGVRLVWRLRTGKKRTSITGLLRGKSGSEEPSVNIEEWLDRVESPAADGAINDAGNHDSNGDAHNHATGFPRDPRLDRSEEQEG